MKFWENIFIKSLLTLSRNVSSLLYLLIISVHKNKDKHPNISIKFADINIFLLPNISANKPNNNVPITEENAIIINIPNK